MLEQDRAALRVFVVWEPMLPTDITSPNRVALTRISDPRTVQFWDKDHLIAGQIKRQLNGQKPSCCEDAGYLWDMAVIYPRESPWKSAAPRFAEGPIYKIASELQRKLEEKKTTETQSRRELIFQNL